MVAGGRVQQKERTRAALVEAARRLVRERDPVTMPAVARAAQVSEATAYRYFADLASLLREADAGSWPDPARALAGLEGETDVVERVGRAAEVVLRRVLALETGIRAMIAVSAARPQDAARRPGHRLDFIDWALGPGAGENALLDAPTRTRLRRELAVVVGADALFTLVDLMGLSRREAAATLVRMARSVTAAALAAPSS